MLAERDYKRLTRWELYETVSFYDTANTARTLQSLQGGLDFPVFDRGLMLGYYTYLLGF